MILVYPIAAFIIALVLLGLMLQKRAWLAADIPNDRSLHHSITPRGGGIAFVVATVLVFSFHVWVGQSLDVLSVSLLVVLSGAALLGWLDDHYGLGIVLRLAIQVALAIFAWTVIINGGTLSPGFWGGLLPAVFVIVWLINLTNFMDGMDGLVASKAIMALVTLAAWLHWRGAGTEVVFCLILAAAVAGFLKFNWHPARVFMGDTGSLALGAVLATVSLSAVTRYDIPFLSCLILLLPFLADSGVTLLTRMLRRERWWEAHRSHFYQRAVQCGYGQRRVIMAFLVIQSLMIILSNVALFRADLGVPSLLIGLAILVTCAGLVHHCERRQ